MDIPEISADDAFARLQAGDSVFVDVRDPNSWQSGHIPGAQNIQDHNVEQFIEEADKQKITIVCCYHGNSSQGGALHFLENGFREVYSMTGGMSAWEGRPLDEGPALTPSDAPSPSLSPTQSAGTHAAETEPRAVQQRGIH